jgi:hypothetical protein
MRQDRPTCRVREDERGLDDPHGNRYFHEGPLPAGACRMSARRIVLSPVVCVLLLACSGGTKVPVNTVAVADGVSHADGGVDAKAPGDTTGVDSTVADGTSGDVEATICLAATDPKAVCDDDGNCASGEYCDDCTRTCRKSRKTCEPCEADEQCAKALVDSKPWSACLSYQGGGSFCGLGCLSDAGCGQGFQCLAVAGLSVKQCIPKTGSCAAGSGSCKVDGDCPFQFVCNPDYGACIKGCTSDTMCATGTVCSLSHCVPPCAADGDCATFSTDAKCLEQHCKFPGGCLVSDECPDKQTHCDLKVHKCVPGCEVDADCKDLSEQCQGGQCAKKGCTKNWQCGYFQVCDVPTGQCQPAQGKYCDPCDPNDENVAACGGKPQKCFGFKDQAGADKGNFCGITCGAEAGGPCPQGWACQELKDDKGASQGKYCLRPCYSKPVGGP